MSIVSRQGLHHTTNESGASLARETSHHGRGGVIRPAIHGDTWDVGASLELLPSDG